MFPVLVLATVASVVVFVDKTLLNKVCLHWSYARSKAVQEALNLPSQIFRLGRFVVDKSLARFVSVLRAALNKERIRRYRREIAWQEAGRASMYPDPCWRCGHRGHFRTDCMMPLRMFCSGCREWGITTRQCQPPSSPTPSPPPEPSHRHKKRAEVSQHRPRPAHILAGVCTAGARKTPLPGGLFVRALCLFSFWCTVVFELLKFF